MQHVNWWLMAVAFLLGLVLTAFLMIRRVKREVPEYAGAAAGGATAAKLVGSSKTEEPYGAGSARVAAGADPPSGYHIKGNEDSMLYHTSESPSYKRTVAEVWFRDVETAEAAGFSRWDSGTSQRESD